MQSLRQPPTDPAFVQQPWAFYDRARALAPLIRWEDLGMMAAFRAPVIAALLRDRRFGRAHPEATAPAVPPHLAAFYAIEAHSMLECDPPRQTRLRRLVLGAFTSARIGALAPWIVARCETLIAAFPRDRPFDLLDAFARPLPVAVICRLLGVPETQAPQLLAWSNAMVGMYQARRDRSTEEAANSAAAAFRDWLSGLIAARRHAPGADLLSQLIAARDEGQTLTEAELISTVILLLNAGHEATVHTIGNALRALLETGAALPDDPALLVEEVLRFDPPLHIFTRIAQTDCTVFGHAFRRAEPVALVIGAAGRDPALCPDPHRFDPQRGGTGASTGTGAGHLAFGAGVHFCLGAPLARLELALALPRLARLHGLHLAEPPRYADIYHFRGQERLMVRLP